MKLSFSKTISMFGAILGFCTYTLHAQVAFQNLGFENGTFIPIPGDQYGRVEFAPGLLGWVGFTATNEESRLLYNNYFLGTAGIALLGAGSPGQYSSPLQGNYSVLLQSGSNPNGVITDYVPATISQIGTVPTGSLSVRLLVSAADFQLQQAFQVSFGGVSIPMFEVGSGPNHKIYGGDISGFAGQTGDLRFSSSPFGSFPRNWIYLDNIQFSNVPIPEPSAVSLFALGALLLRWRWRRNTNL